MAAQLGSIEKPEAEKYRQGRKLYLIPLIFKGKDSPEDYLGIYDRYWSGVAEQLTNLDAKVGKVKRIYHEMVAVSGEEGIKVIEKLNERSHQIAQSYLERGAEAQVTEDRATADESFDWQRCLMIGLTSEKVAEQISKYYLEAMKKRYEYMAKLIDETLQEEEAGILFIREDHAVQFPSDVQVFYVAPPALDEIKRWLRNRAKITEEPTEESA